MKGFAFSVGCKVARAVMWGNSPKLDICEVTRIEDGKIYLNDSKQAIRFPDQLLIIEQDPLYRMIKEYDIANNATS
jgi:hypothetical protein